MAVADIPNPHESRQLQLAMRVSLAVGFLMLGTKVLAYGMTGSAAILADAAESVVHVVAVSFAAYSLWLSGKPPDPTHLYGHDKIAFFSASDIGRSVVPAPPAGPFNASFSMRASLWCSASTASST